jgi:hypothetical protein
MLRLSSGDDEGVRAIASKFGRWYNREKLIRERGEEEDGRDYPARAFCDVGRPSGRPHQAASVRGLSTVGTKSRKTEEKATSFL